MEMQIPKLSLVVLVGPSGSGKSTFARKHFVPTEVLSSDVCRGMVCDDENDQTVTNEAFELLHFIARDAPEIVAQLAFSTRLARLVPLPPEMPCYTTITQRKRGRHGVGGDPG